MTPAQDASLEFVARHSPSVQGIFTLERRVLGKRVQLVQGENICTLTGREFFAMRSVLRTASPRALFREDALRYFGLGTGSQPEVAGVDSLVQPVPYIAGQFLAAAQVPAATSTRTAVQLVREYGRTEISLLGATVVLTEAGTFSDGDPADEWAVGSRPTDMSTAGGDAPLFYKTFEPVTVTPDSTLRLVWEYRFV